MSPPDMPECMVQRQLGRLLITGKGSAQHDSSYKASGQKVDVVALIWLYTWYGNLCSI